MNRKRQPRRVNKRRRLWRKALPLLAQYGAGAVLAVAALMLPAHLIQMRKTSDPAWAGDTLASSVSAVLERQTAPLERLIYPYSVVPGGVASPEEVAGAMQRDQVVAAHYKGFNVRRAVLTTAQRPMLVHVSYRMGDRVYYTKKKVTIQKGEALITDGRSTLRGRCGNRVLNAPPAEVSELEPPEELMDKPLAASTKVLGAPPPEEEPARQEPLMPLEVPPALAPQGAIPPTPPTGGYIIPPVGGGGLIPAPPGTIPPPTPAPTPDQPPVTPPPPGQPPVTPPPVVPPPVTPPVTPPGPEQPPVTPPPTNPPPVTPPPVSPPPVTPPPGNPPTPPPTNPPVTPPGPLPPPVTPPPVNPPPMTPPAPPAPPAKPQVVPPPGPPANPPVTPPTGPPVFPPPEPPFKPPLGPPGEFPPGPSPLDPPWPPSQPPPGIPEPPPIPEPSTYIMIAAGLVAMGWMGRKRKSN